MIGRAESPQTDVLIIGSARTSIRKKSLNWVKFVFFISRQVYIISIPVSLSFILVAGEVNLGRKISTQCRIRTHDLLLASQMLYQPS